MSVSLWERFKAWRRGETVVRGATRGRVFQSKDKDKRQAGGPIRIGASPSATLTMTITRADGTVETVKAPATVRGK